MQLAPSPGVPHLLGIIQSIDVNLLRLLQALILQELSLLALEVQSDALQLAEVSGRALLLGAFHRLRGLPAAG